MESTTIAPKVPAEKISSIIFFVALVKDKPPCKGLCFNLCGIISSLGCPIPLGYPTSGV